MSTRTYRRVALLCVLALLLAAGWYTVLRPEPRTRITARFSTVEGIFPGSAVAILGVEIGRVVSVEPSGTAVAVTMTVPEHIKIPADAHAYIMSPAVISDRFVALAPAYTSGATLGNGAVIPIERTHAPITWGKLTRVLDTLLRALGPQGANNSGSLGELIQQAAEMLGGTGSKFREMLTALSQASGLLAGNTGDIGAVLSDLKSLTALLREHESTIDELADTVRDAAARFNANQDEIVDTLASLSDVLSRMQELIAGHSEKLAGDLKQLVSVTSTLVSHQRDLAEILTTLPLTLENFRRAVSEDNRLRIRLDVSTNLRQFDTTAKLCGLFPIPLCSGKGIVNPVPFPPRLPDVLDSGGGD